MGIDEQLIIKRKEILHNLGGLEEPKVENREWLYLLEEETRNSILVEGYFVSSKELKEILTKNEVLTRSAQEAYNYFKTAKFIYELAYENLKENEFLFGTSLIRQINKSLGNSGEFRKGAVKITGAAFNLPEHFIEEWIKIFVDFAFFNQKKFDFTKLSILHAFFEEIHPFSDGNGRTGRIILNYVLISNGYPLVIIKGDDKNKKLYYKGLEEIDKELLPLFELYKNRAPKKDEVIQKLTSAKSTILKSIILEGLRESIDRMILALYEKRGYKLEPVSKLLKDLGYSEQSVRQLIKRGKVIALKQKNRWLSAKEVVGKFLQR
ncbi:Fic family protein [Nitrosophilus labii]|uniref:Fic family protein n=1 Tax=Nitrosophilus labii TaxID=2706014 RepID=UPI001656B06E|nr:Fic family protein [Nitrosophilus labii]